MTEPKQTHSEKKRCSIVDTAIKLFIEQGFEGTKMDDIAEQADVSKQTIYSHFGSKENLFNGIMDNLCGGYQSLFEQNISQYADNPKEALRLTMRHIIPEILSPQKVALNRLIYAEAIRHPELGQNHLKIMQEYLSDLSEFMQHLAQKGFIKTDNPKTAARDFVSLMKGQMFIESLCSSERLYSEEEVRAHVDHAVDIFFKAYTVR